MKQLPDKSYFDPEATLYQPYRFNHEGCSDGKDDCLIITRVPTGWQVYCHRCKLITFKPIKGLSPSDTIKFVNANKEHESVVKDDYVLLPNDYTTTIPTKGLAFLYKYITAEDVEKYRVVYSPSYNRVIFPIYEGNTLTCWQGRALGEVTKENPKWVIQRTIGKKFNHFKVVKSVGSRVIVLVENILSAIRVGSLSNSWALLGSYIPDELIYILLKEYSKVVIWLDADMLKYAIRMRERFDMFGIVCQVIHTQQKPKDLPIKTISNLLRKENNDEI